MVTVDDMVPFTNFKELFLKEVVLPSFGQSRADRKELQPDYLSPAAKEILASNLRPVLENRRFLKSVYALIKEHDRRATEFIRIKALPAEIRNRITKYRNTQRSLASIIRRIRQLYANLEPSKLNVPDEVHEAIESLTVCQEKLLSKEELLVSRLKPAHRKPHYAKSQWKSLLKPPYREWNPGRPKAIDHWLLNGLNSMLARICEGQRHVSDMTRYKIISELFRAADLGIVEATAIKQYFRSH